LNELDEQNISQIIGAALSESYAASTADDLDKVIIADTVVSEAVRQECERELEHARLNNYRI
jgi:hypothetical protein